MSLPRKIFEDEAQADWLLCRDIPGGGQGKPQFCEWACALEGSAMIIRADDFAGFKRSSCPGCGCL